MNYFNTAIMVTAAAALVLLVKLVFANRITPRGHMLLWVLVAASLLAMPLGGILPESDFSVKKYLPQSQNTTESVWVDPYQQLDARGFIIEEQGDYYTVQTDHVSMQVPFSDSTISGDFAATAFRAKIESCICAAGTAVILLLMLTGTLRQKRRLRKLPLLSDPAILSELEELKKTVGVGTSTQIEIRIGADSTFLTRMDGHYAIALEEGYTSEDQRSVLAHELTHLAHGDLILNLISALLLASFWWNPVIWLAFRRFRRDMEVYCDYDAVRLAGDKKEYARALVRAAAGTERFILGTTSFIGGEKEVSARVKALAAFRKPKTWLAVTAVLTLIIGCVCFALNPPSKDPCTSYFHGIESENLISVRIERNNDSNFDCDFILVKDADLQRELVRLFHSFKEKDFTEGEPVSENYSDYRLQIDTYTQDGEVGKQLMLLRDEEAGDDVYCIILQEDGTEDSSFSGKRIHSPKLTKLLRDCEVTNLHMSFWADARSSESVDLYIENTEFDNPDSSLQYDASYNIEHYTGSKDYPYADDSWEALPELTRQSSSETITSTLNTGEIIVLTVDFSEKYGGLPEGFYRISKTFTQKLRSGNTVTQERTAIFEWCENRLHFVDWDFLLSQPEGDLDKETIDNLNKIFETRNKNTLYCFFTSKYSNPAKMDFYEFLRYYPSFDDFMEWTPELKETFESSDFWSDRRKEGQTVDNYPTPVHLYKPEILNKGLEYYAGISLDDIKANNTQEYWDNVYVKEIDRYVNFTSDSGGGIFQPQSGMKKSGKVTLYGAQYGDGSRSVLTLKEKDGRYLIQSFLSEK